MNRMDHLDEFGFLTPPNRETKNIALPDSSLHIAFGAHATAHHAEVCHPAIESADLVLYERFAHSRQPENAIQMADFRNRLSEIIIESGKPSAILDLPRDSGLSYQIERQEEFLSLPFSPNFDETVVAVQKHLQAIRDLETKREEYMVDQLPHVVAQALATHPELSAKSPLKLAMILGADHRRLVDTLNARHYHWLKHVSAGTLEDFPLPPRTINREDAIAYVMQEAIEHSPIGASLDMSDMAAYELKLAELSRRVPPERVQQLYDQAAKNGSGKNILALMSADLTDLSQLA